MTQVLPPQPNLKQYKNQAKSLVKAHQRRDPATLIQIKSYHPRLAALSEAEIWQVKFLLSDAQWIIARAHGFASWPKFKQQVEILSENVGKHRPFVKDLAYYDERAFGLLSVYQSGQKRALNLIRQFHPQFTTATDEEILQADISKADTQLVLAREHGFETWAALEAQVEALAAGAVNEPFMDAYEAIKAGNVDRLKLLLQQEPSLVNAQGTNGNTLLTLATSMKQVACVNTLIEGGADVNLGNNKGWTPLHAAAYGDPGDEQGVYPELLQIFLDAGAAVELMAHGDGGTPLMQALFWGHRPQAEILAIYGVVPYNLRAAAGLGRLDLIASFFNADGTLTPEAGQHREFHRPHSGFPPWTPSDDSQEVLDEALVFACKSGRLEVLDELVRRGATLDGEPYNGTPLFWAASRGHAAVVNWLLDHGAQINKRANYGGEKDLAVLHVAAWAGKLEIVKLLAERGANVNYRDNNYHAYPWGWAQHFGYTEIERFLLDYSAKSNILAAATLGQIEQVEVLLGQDSKLVNFDDGYSTPLYQAIAHNHPELVRYLLQQGAEPNLQPDGVEKSPIALAEALERDEIVTLLQEGGGGD